MKKPLIIIGVLLAVVAGIIIAVQYLKKPSVISISAEENCPFGYTKSCRPSCPTCTDQSNCECIRSSGSPEPSLPQVLDGLEVPPKKP